MATRAAFPIEGGCLSTCSRSLNAAVRHLGSLVGGRVSHLGGNNFEPAIIGQGRASQMEDAPCGLNPICGNQIRFLNGRSLLMMLMLVSLVPSEFAWAITFGRSIARFCRSLFRRRLPTYCVVWIARGVQYEHR